MKPLRFDYDSVADVLHVTFGTGEPSFAEELDDQLVLEIGIYSGAPTGFQLLHVRELGIGKVQVQLRRSLDKARTQEGRLAARLASSRNRMLNSAFKALAREVPKLVAA